MWSQPLTGTRAAAARAGREALTQGSLLRATRKAGLMMPKDPLFFSLLFRCTLLFAASMLARMAGTLTHIWGPVGQN